MMRRIYNVLIVANPYDAFMLEDDGRIEEKIYNEYMELGLRYPPMFTRVSTTEEAMHVMHRALEGRDGERLYLGGTSQLLAHPEYRDLERVRELTILAESESRAGVYAIANIEKRQFFITGHAEYDPLTLKAEYDRDHAAGRIRGAECTRCLSGYMRYAA